jgi:predicted O-methyltransferase YrrM
MGSFWFNVKYVMLHHPSFIGQYLTRNLKLSALFERPASEFSGLFSEGRRFVGGVHHRLERYPYLGWMDRRKNELLYVAVRCLRPECVVETGVGAGASSWVILEALRKNGSGRLCSIDIGAKSFDGLALPESEHIGFLVPGDLRSQWELVIGPSGDVLPKMMKSVRSVDMFCHDSLHTYENMMFEFMTTFPHLKVGGILASDNVELNNAFDEFCHAVGAKHEIFYGFGLARKVSDV